ncbi:MarR family winged helix-turn-helix transcriptional regulator [Microbulbifer thermotolerans]|uniref:MarR family transcriptional regulator n=1 Tax=Microbulbifer thermotolerans TaxID=252514 RepID=A0A143HPL9_MICTH|nr:MarR family transcriptional regulator [Microbulbifer thermotolerans]AMX03663.1 MarR family transcriptional regulator [Microbulbifer thermotolerans]MCX2780933.1 MarR family transcriptional regulator [Microbulbifer thermotolerans]MCX2782082.1 MarR family transcriptional regulator [Microbulbifer thermotolerans]MCX2796213.1 MarR family transcriptional regulator [Microbulbifer thermotolerans]MCX2802554.1 MarR family transcriptional regulator [Microbulbifer thermotolerans]
MAKSNIEDLKLDNQLCFSLYSTSLAMSKTYKPLLEKLGLTYPQYLMMLVLWEEDGITATELGHRLRQDKGALSPVIKRLEAQGLIERRRDANDERRVHLQLTTEGKSLRRKAESIPRQVLCAGGLDRKSAQQLKAQIDALRRSLDTPADTGDQ